MSLIARLAELAKGPKGLRLEIQTKDDRTTIALIPKVTSATESDLDNPTQGPLLRCLTRPIAITVPTTELETADGFLETTLAGLSAERASLESELERFREEAAIAKKNAQEAAKSRASGKPGAKKPTPTTTTPKLSAAERSSDESATDEPDEPPSSAPVTASEGAAAPDSDEPDLFD